MFVARKHHLSFLFPSTCLFKKIYIYIYSARHISEDFCTRFRVIPGTMLELAGNFSGTGAGIARLNTRDVFSTN